MEFRVWRLSFSQLYGCDTQTPDVCLWIRNKHIQVFSTRTGQTRLLQMFVLVTITCQLSLPFSILIKLMLCILSFFSPHLLRVTICGLQVINSFIILTYRAQDRLQPVWQQITWSGFLSFYISIYHSESTEKLVITTR